MTITAPAAAAAAPAAEATSASVSEVISASELASELNRALRTAGGAYSDYSCKTVSWDDVQRGTVGGGLSCWGGNITDTRLYAKDGQQLYTVRSDNFNEKLGAVSASELALITGNQTAGGGALTPITLQDVLKNFSAHGKYAGVDGGIDLSDAKADEKVSVRFMTTFLPVADEKLSTLEFAPEVYQYQTRSEKDPANLLLLATTQGFAVQANGSGATKLFHHAVEPSGSIARYWFEAERSEKKVGGAQKETKEEALEAASRGKATAAVIGTRSMGTRFNVLMTIQVPLQQQPPPARRGYKSGFGGGGFGASKKKSGFGGGGFGGGFNLSLSMKSKKSSFVEDESDDECDDSDDYEEEGGKGKKSAALSDDEELMGGCLDGAESDDDWCMDVCAAASFGAPPPPPPMASAMMPMSRGGRRSSAPRPPPKVGKANAARVSRGSMVDRVEKTVEVKAPKRDPSQHVTVTVVVYNTVAGGVPSSEDVKAAVDDMEQLYASCGWKGRLADEGASFMKQELTVKSMGDIAAKLAEQPYVPPTGAIGLVQGGDVFPTSAVA